VIPELQSDGLQVRAPANPLRGVAADAAYIASVASQIDGPVVLVGHSYGGAVITVAGAAADNVVGLVYVAAFIPDEGESLADILADYADTQFATAARPEEFPLDGTGEKGVELYLAPEAFPAAFAADLPSEVAAVAAVSQRPFATAGAEEKAGAAGWKTLRFWTMVATADQMIPPDAERFMAERAGAHTIVEVEASHSIAVSQPAAVADLIRSAVRTNA
jgi:pimeloyl-ACP methyl ester carboxylesterase